MEKAINQECLELLAIGRVPQTPVIERQRKACGWPGSAPETALKKKIHNTCDYADCSLEIKSITLRPDLFRS